MFTIQKPYVVIKILNKSVYLNKKVSNYKSK